MNITRKTCVVALIGAGVWLTCSAFAQDAKPFKPRPVPAGAGKPAGGAPAATGASGASAATGAAAASGAAAATGAQAAPAANAAQSAPATPAAATSKPDAAASMQRWQAANTPGAAHKQLERFLGRWSTVTTVHGIGSPNLVTQGAADWHWLYEGRWLQQFWTGSLMGQPQHGQTTLGYDNFKQRYVCSTIDNVQTAMLASEGSFDEGRATLITYGRADEPMSGECDKQFKYLWRFESPEKLVYEVHDLSLGETNTLVMDVVYTKKKGP